MRALLFVMTVKTAAQDISGHVTGEDKDWLFPFLYHLLVVCTDTDTHTQHGEVWSTKVICSANKTQKVVYCSQSVEKNVLKMDDNRDNLNKLTH